MRAQQAEDNLNRIIGNNNLQLTLEGIVSSTAYNSDTLKVYVATLNSEPTILARDETHPLPLPMLSVTDTDAQYQGIPIE